jgi:hypothetical protein
MQAALNNESSFLCNHVPKSRFTTRPDHIKNGAAFQHIPDNDRRNSISIDTDFNAAEFSPQTSHIGGAYISMPEFFG